MKWRILFFLVIVGIPGILGLASTAFKGWHLLFDDAFISYRYADNLALGHGITWNPSEGPTEGYTNFLLVVILAPCIKVGFDPLLVTRLLSYLSVLGIAAIAFAVAKSRNLCSTPTAMLIASLIILAPQTRDLCLTGLETVLYAFFLLITYHWGIELVHSQRNRDAVVFSSLIFLTMLLRPEAGLLYPIVLYLYCTHGGSRQRSNLQPVGLSLLLVLTFGSAYLIWKLNYFGHLLPNPFYIKVSGNSLVSSMGVISVLNFVVLNSILVALICPSLVLRNPLETDDRRKNSTAIVMGVSFFAVTSCFFAHIDTMMDVASRFMYPLLPIVIYLTTPVIAAVLRLLETRADGRILKHVGILFAFMLVFAPNDLREGYRNAKILTLRDEGKSSNALMQKEYRIAKGLASFPGIESVRIAFGDSGVIPYFTGAVWLDTVGLNSDFIARNRDHDELVNYFFQWKPDLIIHPANKDHSWVRYGHGPLGDVASWANDPRWDDYLYVGTCRSSDWYDLHFFVCKSSRTSEPLEHFLRSAVLDGWYETLPISIGTLGAASETQPKWIPRLE